MGNILCLPKKRKKSDSGSDKKKRKWCLKKSRRVDDTSHVEKGATFVREGGQTQDHDVNETDLNIISSRSAELYVCPVVSSSILLRHDDDDDVDDDDDDDDYDDNDDNANDRELSKDHNVKEQVDQTNQSDGIERSAVAKDILCEESIDNARTAIVTVERLSENATLTEQENNTEKEQTSIVRVIKVQEASGSPSPLSKHLENEEEKCATEVDKLTEQRVQDESHISGTESIELCEADKSSENRKTPADLKVLCSEVQKRDGKPTGNETNETSIRNKTTQFKINESEGTENVTGDEENGKQPRFKVEKVLEEIKPVEDHKVKNVKSVCVKSICESSGKTQESFSDTDDHKHVASINTVVVKSVMERKTVTEISDVETPSKEIEIKGTVSCPSVPEQRPVPSVHAEFDALLNVLSTLQTLPEKARSDALVPTSANKRLVFGPQSDSSDKVGFYKSKQGIENWIHNSKQGTPSSATENEGSTTVALKSNKKVSDFNVPWKPRKLPPKPLPLKKPSSHLFKIPDVAKSDLDDDDINWTQLEPKGPQTEVLWTTKPSAFDVKLPPLPKRLLERKGSVEKLQESWIIPQVKQIETLKREHGRFPGLVVPTALRNKYSVDIKNELKTTDEVEESELSTENETSVEGIVKGKSGGASNKVSGEQKEDKN